MIYPPADSLATEMEGLIDEPTLRRGGKGMVIGASAGLLNRFKSDFNPRKLVELKFPREWQNSSLTLAESLELGAIWLELDWREGNSGDLSVPRPSF